MNIVNKKCWFGAPSTRIEMPTRRGFMKSAAMLAGGVALAGCAATQAGNVTTITLNVAEVNDYGQAVLSFAKTAISVSFVASALGTAGLATANTVITGLSDALAAFKAAAGNSTSVTYDSTNVKSAFDSILADVEQVNSLIVATITGTATTVGNTVVSDAKTAANAAAALISLIKAMVDMTGPRLSVARQVSAVDDIARIAVFSAEHP